MLPQEVQDILSKHIDNVYERAEQGWACSKEDEDSITGDFLGNLRSDWIEDMAYKVKFSYNKLRGRGSGALEKTTGADGIITIEYDDSNTKKYKSLVFQAKKKGNSIVKDQQKKMDELFPNGNAIFEYSENGYYTITNLKKVRINDFLKQIFFSCKVGCFDLFYADGSFYGSKIIQGKFSINHELKIEIVQ